MYTWVDPKCGKTIMGQRTEHCSSCHRDFRSTHVGDAHRIGPHEPTGQRRCRTDDEMIELGYVVDQYGRWHEPMTEKNRRRLEILRSQ